MSREFESLIESLRAGEVNRWELYALSGLSPGEAERVWEVACTMPASARLVMISSLVEIAEESFEVDFGAIFRVALTDDEPDVRALAVEGLWEDEDVRLVPVLVALLQDSAAHVRAAAATSLGRFVLLGELERIRERPYRQVIQALLTVCRADGETIEVHRRALESLAYTGEEEVIGLIEEAYYHPDERMRVSALFAMGRSADERWETMVVRELDNPAPEMRYEAARACGELALDSAVDVLIELAEDVDAEVQQAAIWALGQIGGDDARSLLQEYIHSANEAVREAAIDALRELEFLYGDLGALLLFDFGEEE